MLSFIGGTGPEGLGLAIRLALAGERVIIGSRSLDRAQEAARSVLQRVPAALVAGSLNIDAAKQGDMVFLSVPYGAQRGTLSDLKEHLKGKIVVSVVGPLLFQKGRARAIRVEAGSAAEETQQLLPDARVVSAFQNVSAEGLMVPDKDLGCDVIVCSDDAEARARVMSLAAKIRGVRPLNGGPLENSRYVEELTALLLNLNRTYKAHTSIKVTGI